MFGKIGFWGWAMKITQYITKKINNNYIESYHASLLRLNKPQHLGTSHYDFII